MCIRDRVYAGVTNIEDDGNSVSENKLTWQQQKEEQARIRKRENDLRRLEEQITELEARDAQIDQLLTLEEIYTDVEQCIVLNKEKTDIAGQLEKLMISWEELAE